jgi:hypothetical protein
MKKTRLDLKGKQFGRLTVLEYSHTNKHGQSMWKCRCACGSERIVTGSHLKSGHSISCGCYNAEAAKDRRKTHGKRKTRLYRIWLNMKARCTIESVSQFKNYGGRGITVCEEWANSFQAFYDWAMSNGYDENAPRGKCTIDRIDVNGNYEPSNCRWVSIQAQQFNKSTSKTVTLNGETHTLKEWSDKVGVNYSTMHSRYRAGKPPEEILRTIKAV